MEPPSGWDRIPGARGCTPQTCAYRDDYSAFQQLGVGVFGLSAQAHSEQREFAVREHVPFPLLSDPALELAAALHLPAFVVEDLVLYCRVTLVVDSGRIVYVRYPVLPPASDADATLAWLRAERTRGRGDECVEGRCLLITEGEHQACDLVAEPLGQVVGGDTGGVDHPSAGAARVLRKRRDRPGVRLRAWQLPPNCRQAAVFSVLSHEEQCASGLSESDSTGCVQRTMSCAGPQRSAGIRCGVLVSVIPEPTDVVRQDLGTLLQADSVPHGRERPGALIGVEPFRRRFVERTDSPICAGPGPVGSGGGRSDGAGPEPEVGETPPRCARGGTCTS